jgi:hypothetical protein
MTICFRVTLGCAFVATMLVGKTAQCQRPATAAVTDPGQFYSQGVHAYFAGRSAQADELMSRALAVDPTDPRAYYFRGLARLRMGRSQDGRTDLQVGASMEAQQPGRFHLGQALERVQGGDRLLLERIRREGQTASASASAQRARVRYEQIVDRETHVLHHPGSIALDQIVAGGRPPALRPQPRTPPDPAWSMASLRPAQAPPAASASDDPFPDDPVGPSAGAARATGGNASAVPPARPASPARAEKDGNPFGESAPPAIPPQPAEAAPTGTNQTTPRDENPFGDLFGR